jgi:hypothetical protein
MSASRSVKPTRAAAIRVTSNRRFLHRHPPTNQPPTDPSPPGRGWPKAGRGAAWSLAKTRQNCGRIRGGDPERNRVSPKRACRARSTIPDRRPRILHRRPPTNQPPTDASPPGRGWPKAGRGAAWSPAKTRQDCGRIRRSVPQQERVSPKRACRARSTSPGRRPGLPPPDRPGPVGAVHRGRAESAGSHHSAPTTRFPRSISTADVQQVGKPVPPPR